MCLSLRPRCYLSVWNAKSEHFDLVLPEIDIFLADPQRGDPHSAAGTPDIIAVAGIVRSPAELGYASTFCSANGKSRLTLDRFVV